MRRRSSIAGLGSSSISPALLGTLWLLVGCLALGGRAVFAAANMPIPSYSDVSYGPHARNTFDLWLASSSERTPLLLLFHWGGFSEGDKADYARFRAGTIREMLEAGISVAAINHRLTEGGRNLYPAPMLDGARTIQFLRFHAETYNLDKTRFAGLGGSSGGCMVTWLGFHPDLAQPDHEDPVLRESSRLQLLAPEDGQSCLHLPTLEAWFGVASLAEHPAYRPLFGIPPNGEIHWTEDLDAAMWDASPISHLSADDPPIFLFFRREDGPVDEETEPNVWAHHPIMGIKLKEQMDAVGLECHVLYSGGPPVPGYASLEDFIIRKLTEPEPPP